jgi:hypothetical protein
MRKALNENPVVQIAVIGVMAIAVAILLYTRVIAAGNDAPPASDTATTATDTAAAPAGTTPAPADSATGTATPAPATPPTEAPATTPPATGGVPAPVTGDPASAFVPGPGLPEDVVVAYARNKAVVLLIEKEKGLDDRALRASARALEGRDDLAFFSVPVKDVARYARITEGVDLSRTPALVIIRPRKLTNNTPEATVSYGFRGPESVETAVDDALYDGKNVTYDP